MAETKWTKEQRQVIDARGRNLLVAAAAGSGKTAVLVERIIEMVTDKEKPVDIDKLLVMTFTNAAASEMRERIGDALEKRLEENPGDENLERQTTLIHHAKITTIDSFCLQLLREHFNELDIDPGFRIGDEGELLLLQADVMKELLEEYYGKNDERFFRFVDTYASGKADGGLEDYILQVWRFSQSNPWPGEWIAACRAELDKEENGNPESFADSEWMRFLLQDVKKQVREFKEQLYEAIALSGEEDGPQAYLPMLTADVRNMERLCEAGDYEEIYKLLSEPMFGRLAAVRNKQTDPKKKEEAAAIRNRVKDGIKKMKALYVPGDMEHIFSDMAACREPVLMLLELANEFTARFQEAKEEKNLVDFNDLEHFALDILTGGSKDHSPGPVADELSGVYEEILVDEYQDSNDVQETLIRLISRERFGTPNVFMVGDVKQSIYKFRLAKPELFLEKYETYKKEEGSYQKIELHKNFRSRSEVLSGINDVFYSIMTKELGDIQYTEDAALYPGAGYPETLKEGQAKTEVLLLNTGEELFLSMDEERADYTAKEAEARLIAAKIKELTDPETGMKVWNGKKEQYEPLKKKDIVILLRSLSGWAEEFLSVLSAEGIPAFAESKTGYFTAAEVETVLNMLALIDNPMQDIPLVGVLKSPIGGLSDRELAVVMAEFKQCADKGQDGGFYGAVRHWLEAEKACGGGCGTVSSGSSGPNAAALPETGSSDMAALTGKDSPAGAALLGTSSPAVVAGAVGSPSAAGITKKLAGFWNLLSGLRKEAEYLPVHRLLYRIFELTGYYDYVSAMPAGKVRQANLNMLVEKAAAFEKTSYQSLFDFIRYIERLKKYNTDFGEAAKAGENDDTVRIMSIHKSKGLEFPVVFLAGAGKQFNRQDSRGKILIDERLGVSTDFVDLEQKVKAPTLKKNVLSRRMNLESMGEELRILYVAMTRAKEKLIITAADKYLENRIEKWGGIPGMRGLPFTYLSAAGSYLDWLLMASGNAKESVTIRQVPVKELLQAETESQAEKAGIALTLKYLREEENFGSEKESRIKESRIKEGRIKESGIEENQIKEGRIKESGIKENQIKENWIDDDRMREKFGGMLKYQYPHEADIRLHAKMSVSELKERGQFVDDGESNFLPTIPRFLREDAETKADGLAAGKRLEAEIDGWAAREEPEAEAGGWAAGKEREMGAGSLAAGKEPEPGAAADRDGEKPQKKPVSALGGTFRGTAYHRALELLPFKDISSIGDLRKRLEEIETKELMDKAATGLINAGVLWKFFKTSIAGRMREADRAGNLHKESQFVMGVPAVEMDEADSDELVLIQGIIDAWFEEADGLVLVDYKTDRIKEGEESVLLDRYRIQMVYYARALEQITGKKVKESVIYSLTLQKEIPVFSNEQTP